MTPKPIYELWDEDALLFEQMKGHYQSEEERIFFEKIRYKELYEPADSNELLLLEEENDDLVYIIRISSSEYQFGSGEYGHQKDQYVETLYDMLNTNVEDIGITSMRGTMLDWLRSINYKGIRYDRNLEMM